MSSTESSGAPAEATATPTAPDAAFPTFGSTRGSGLARGKGKRISAPAAATAASTAYTPTAIEVINAPREYTNPFAPVNPEPAEQPAPVPAPVEQAPAPSAVGLAKADPAPVKAYSAPVEQAPVEDTPADLSDEASAKSELNILEPEQQKTSPAQTWESEGFRPARAERSERPRREESRRDEPRREERAERPSEPFDPASIPEKFLYVRPGHTYVPTPTNFGGAPRERSHAPREAYAPAASSSAPAAEKSGGFLGWLKSLFGGSPSSAPVTASGQHGEARRDGGEHRRHRGGRNRSGGQGGGQGRSRGGRGGRGGSGGYRSEGSSQGGI